MKEDIYFLVEKERQRALALWTELDEENTLDDYILYSLAYLGRATSAARNKDLDAKEMLIKAMGLLVTGIEKRIDN